MGHILNQFTKAEGEDWQKTIWQDVLDLQYSQVSAMELNEKYADLYAVSKISMSSPGIISRFKGLNEGKQFSRQVKPFNFTLLGIGMVDETGMEVKPIAPFHKNSQSAVFKEFINYNDGSKMSGKQYWKTIDSIFFDYLDHEESKFEGNEGVLNRRSLIVRSMLNIGKESNNLEDTQVLGVSDGAYQTYIDEKELLRREEEIKDFILLLKIKTAAKYCISKLQLMRMKKKIRENIPVNLSTINNNKLITCFSLEKQ